MTPPGSTTDDEHRAEREPSAPQPTPSSLASPSQPLASLPWWWNASLIALGLAMALFRLIPTEADPDLWGHLRFGVDTLDTGSIVRPDIYSYVSGLPGAYPWINHEWLAEAITAIAWTAAGAAGIVAVKVMLGLTVAVVVCRHLTRRGVPMLGALLMTAYGMAVILPGLRSLRPQAFTYLAFALLLVWIHRASRGRAAWLAMAPPLMALWANLHGGFVAGLGVLGVWLAAEIFVARGRRRSVALAIFAASVAATLVTPYGWTLWTFLARTLGPRPEIVEWQGVSLVTMQGLAYLGVTGAGVTGLFLSRRPRPAIDILLIASAALLPLIAQRHLPLTVLIVLVIGGEHIASAAPLVVRRLTTHPSTTSDRAANTKPTTVADPASQARGERSEATALPIHGAAPALRAQSELAATLSDSPAIAQREQSEPTVLPIEGAAPALGAQSELAATLSDRAVTTQREQSEATALPIEGAAPALGAQSELAATLSDSPAITQREQSEPTVLPAHGDRFRPLVAAALLVEAGLLFVLMATSAQTGRIVYKSGEYPVEAVARLAEFAAAGGTANVAVHFDWGEYVLWHAGPRVKVSMDGRRETVYSDAAYHDNSLFIDGVGEWDRLLARRPRDARDSSDTRDSRDTPESPGTNVGHDTDDPRAAYDSRGPRRETDLALVPAGTAVHHLMSMHPDWELVMKSGPAALFGRRGSPVTSQVHAIPVRAVGADTTLIFP